MRRAGLLPWSAVALAVGLMAFASSAERRLDGFNVITAPGHPFGSASAGRSLLAAKQVGAKAVAIIPFLWQPDPSSTSIARGNDMPDEELRAAIRQARALGLVTIVKPHVWVPRSWAGAVEPQSEEAWHQWFAAYGRALERIAQVAAEENADALAIGTELGKTSHRPEWIAVIAAARAAFPRTLIYVAHNADEAEQVPFWDRLDMIGVSLYPPLGDDQDRAGRIAVMRALARRLEAISERSGKPVLVAEIGLRSAEGAAKKPWESAEERPAVPDPQLQADVIADWLEALKRPAITGVLVWRWFSDPAAGGIGDTDFTVQGKPAQAVLRCAWTAAC
jgi:hypothetical protein